MESQYREHRHSSSFSAFMATIGSIVFGALIGAAVALLMAPKSGEELRTDLREGANRMGERISDTSHEVVESMRDKISQIGREAEKMGEKAQRAAEDIAER
ncbi:MAG: YtxH domain-containing protein [Armatimonadia bacterium]